MSDVGGGQVRINVEWVQEPTSVPAPVNQFTIVGGPGVFQDATPDTYVITAGHVTPPALPAFTSQADAEAFMQQNMAYIVPVARLSFTLGRLRELHNAIGQVLAAEDRA